MSGFRRETRLAMNWLLHQQSDAYMEFVGIFAFFHLCLTLHLRNLGSPLLCLCVSSVLLVCVSYVPYHVIL